MFLKLQANLDFHDLRLFDLTTNGEIFAPIPDHGHTGKFTIQLACGRTGKSHQCFVERGFNDSTHEEVRS